jgi:hypothetical protein
MTSGRRTARVPAPSDLHTEPPLGPFLLLEFRRRGPWQCPPRLSRSDRRRLPPR